MFRTQVDGIKGCRPRINLHNRICCITYGHLAQVVNKENWLQKLYCYACLNPLLLCLSQSR